MTAFSCRTIPFTLYATQPYLESYSIDDARRELRIVVSSSFATQEFTKKSADFYYRRLAKSLPKPYNRYRLVIETAGMPIEQLVAGAKTEPTGTSAFWGGYKVVYYDAYKQRFYRTTLESMDFKLRGEWVNLLMRDKGNFYKPMLLMSQEENNEKSRENRRARIRTNFALTRIQNSKNEKNM